MSEYRPFLILSPLHKSLRNVDVYLGKKFKPYGFSISEAHLLGYLINNSPSPVNKLIRVFGFKNSTLTSIINRLEKKGMLRRKISMEDRRSYQIELTKSGQKIATELYNITRELEDKILKNISDLEISSLNNIAAELEKTCNGD